MRGTESLTSNVLEGKAALPARVGAEPIRLPIAEIASELRSGPTHESLRWMLDYEIRGSERYRRFLSILMIAADEDEKEIDRLRGMLRISDEIVLLDRWHAAVLLRETDVVGTLSAVNRYKALYSEMVRSRFAIASYPTDGLDASLLLGSACDRMKQAMNEPDGTIVAV